MGYENVVSSDVQDIYRLKYGVLLVVTKIDSCIARIYNYDIMENKKALKKERHTDYYKVVKPFILKQYGGEEILVTEDMVVFDGFVCIASKDKKDFEFTIKTTGNCFNGNFKSLPKTLNMITEIMNSY